MNNNEYATDLASFLDSVMSPSEAFAKIFIDGCIGVPVQNMPRAGFEDIGVVAGALTALSRRQLQEFADMLQSQVGKIEVSQPTTYTIPNKVCQVILEKSEEQVAAQAVEADEGNTPQVDEGKIRRRIIREILEGDPDLSKKQ